MNLTGLDHDSFSNNLLVNRIIKGCFQYQRESIPANLNARWTAFRPDLNQCFSTFCCYKMCGLQDFPEIPRQECWPRDFGS